MPKTLATAAVLDEHGVLCVALAGRDIDDLPRSVEVQAWNPEHVDYDPDDDEGYCLVNEDHVPVVGGRRSAACRTGALPQADRRGCPSLADPDRDVHGELRLDDQSVERLRHELRRLFGLSGANRPAPKLDL